MPMFFGCNSVNNSNGLNKREETIMTIQSIQERVKKAAKALLEKQGHEFIQDLDDEQVIISYDDDDRQLVFTKYQWEEGRMPDPNYSRSGFEQQALAFVTSDTGREWADYGIRADVLGMAVLDDRAFVRQIHNYDFFYGKVN